VRRILRLLARLSELNTWQLMVLLGLLAIAAVGGVFLHIAQLRSHLIEVTARTYAEMYVLTLNEVRTVYTADVVGTAIRHGMTVSHDYLGRAGTIPLPATLTMVLGERIGEKTRGTQVRLYSPYPFPWRAVERRLDQFGNDAWQQLREHPEKGFWRVEPLADRLMLRYAIADVMRPACVGCHNQHPDSPKRDWQVGDVRGVLEVSIPIDEAALGVQRSLQGTLLLLLVIAAMALTIVAFALTQLRYRMETHRRLARTDALTGLPNRRVFNEMYPREWQRASRGSHALAVLMIDIDQFKLYNDQFGHLAGDVCLKQVAKVLQAVTRRTADLGARYGGEELIVVLPETDLKGALIAAELLRKQIAELAIPHAISASHPVVTVSIGVASTVPTADREAETLVRQADEALYRAKASGRNHVAASV